MKNRRVTVSVINDLVTDQRVHRTCCLLKEIGYEVTAIGRKLGTSLPLTDYPCRAQRMKLLFEKGPAFYICFNIRLFFLLMFKKTDLYFSNDLDTLLPNYIVSRIKNKPLIYDAHEYFTEVPELLNRPLIRNIWRTIERITVPKVRHMITVNESIANLYHEKYGNRPTVVRNIPDIKTGQKEYLTREDLGLPEGKKILILQGSGINIQRGAEETVEAMRYTEKVLLLIVGGGDVLPLLKKLVREYSLEEKVRFIPKVPMEKLKSYTRLANGGLTVDKNTNINYRFSLPNKLFDYIHAGIPVLASDLPEVRKIIRKYDIGIITENHDPEILAKNINLLLFDDVRRNEWKENLAKAARELNWEEEKKILSGLIKKAVGP